MSLYERPPIFALPDELLAAIFRVCVNTGQSPTVLSHVCRLWRQIASDASGLWNIIDLRHIRRAKHHLTLAHNQKLRVKWLYQRQALPTMQKYEWVWGYAACFSHLSLVVPVSTLIDIMGSIQEHLTRLEELTISATFCVDRTRHCPFLLRSPYLRSLSLAGFCVLDSHMMFTLSSSPLLENLELVGLWTPPNPTIPSRPVNLPRLRNYTLASLPPEILDFFLSAVPLPQQGTLQINISRFLFPAGFELRQATMSALAPIRFTSVSLNALSIEYSESTNPSKATLSMKIGDFMENMRGPGHNLDLSRVATLNVYDMKRLLPRPAGDVDFVMKNIKYHIHTLVIHRQALETRRDHGADWLSPFQEAVSLQTLVLHGLDLAISTDIGAARIRVVAAFIGSLTPKSLSKVMLRGCVIDAAGLNTLDAIVQVEAVDY